MNVEEIAVHENSTVIDVRTEREFRNDHLKNALNITYDVIKNKTSEHVTDKQNN